MPMKRSTVAVVTGVSTLAAAGVLAALAIPAAVDWFEGRHDEASSYRTAAEAKADRASFPRWLPDDAAGVEYRMKTTGGDRLVKATLPRQASAPAALPAGCAPYEPAAGLPAPELKADWFPEKAETRATARCGLFHVFLDGDTLYGWQSHKDWVADNKAGAK
ncbi:hypothetical protein AB0G79_32945 [Streptomyces sp. NPDC020807]|uniref:hypothetical protein n=1 Tax=Streptomyces sp. NPDC020807 TaxID=3155119 RepID=UPI0033C0CBDC